VSITLNYCSWQVTGVNGCIVIQIIQVTHSDLPCQLFGLPYEVDIIFYVDANPNSAKFMRITLLASQKMESTVFCVLFILSFSLNWSSPEFPLFFEWGMYTHSGVSSIVMILCNIRSPTCSKVYKFIWQHYNLQACISAVKRRGTKREHNFPIPVVANNVCRVIYWYLGALWAFWSWIFFHFG